MCRYITASRVGFHPVRHNLLQPYISASACGFQRFQFDSGHAHISTSHFCRQLRYALRHSHRESNALPHTADVPDSAIGNNRPSEERHLYHLLVAVSLFPDTLFTLHPCVESPILFILIILVILLAAQPFGLIVHMNLIILGLGHIDIRHFSFQHHSLIISGIGKRSLHLRLFEFIGIFLCLCHFLSIGFGYIDSFPCPLSKSLRQFII